MFDPACCLHRLPPLQLLVFYSLTVPKEHFSLFFTGRLLIYPNKLIKIDKQGTQRWTQREQLSLDIVTEENYTCPTSTGFL